MLGRGTKESGRASLALSVAVEEEGKNKGAIRQVRRTIH